MRTFVSHLALLLEDEEQEIIDIWKNGFLSHFYIELFLRDGSLVARFSKTYPSFLTLKEGSTSHLGLLPSGKKRKTALQC